jgi:ADP-ribose pyrophosphatase
MATPRIDTEKTKQLLETPFIRVYDLAYDDGTHYFDASRRTADTLLALRPAEELTQMLPDAVSCCLILEVEGSEPRLVLFYEYRYPTGQYMLSIPSGLIDSRDVGASDPVIASMTREIAEECGITLGADDDIWVVSPFLFNTPGFTDESTALLCAVVRRKEPLELAHPGAEGTEHFGGFELLTHDEVMQVLVSGRDPHGHFYPMVAWTAMSYFVSEAWRERV